jgi:tRNA(Leu) C34 or U34 (ribose-2'-O)-methylase TrmL
MSFGIGLDRISKDINYGGVMRSAYNFGASFVFTVGRRYRRTKADTPDTGKHIPIFHYNTWEEYWEHNPPWQHYAIEIKQGSYDICKFNHPKSAVYIFGPEDGSVCNAALKNCVATLSIPTNQCLNLATCVGIICYDRKLKGNNGTKTVR